MAAGMYRSRPENGNNLFKSAKAFARLLLAFSPLKNAFGPEALSSKSLPALHRIGQPMAAHADPSSAGGLADWSHLLGVTPVRDIESAVEENKAFHAEECRQSKCKFFSFGIDFENEGEQMLWEGFPFPGEQLAAGVDAMPPAPFGPNDLVRVSRCPLFSVQECNDIIQEAESQRAWRGAQPLANYAKNASVFCPVRELPRTAQWFDQQLEKIIYPAIAQAFPYHDLETKHLLCSAASIVKYNATAGQTRLGVHRDGPLVAATIPLNGLDEYDGGGTYFEALASCSAPGHDQGVIRRDTGHLILHPAVLRHGGATIRRGLRYILVCWVFSEQHVPHDHYSTQRASRFLAAALRIPALSGSAFRQDLLRAAAEGFGEALLLGVGNWTESAHVGLGQALLEITADSSKADVLQVAQRRLEEALLRAPENIHATKLLLRARVLLTAAEATP